MSEQPMARRRATSVVATPGADAPTDVSDAVADESAIVTASADTTDTLVDDTPDVGPTGAHESQSATADLEIDDSRDGDATTVTAGDTTVAEQVPSPAIVRRRPRVRRVTRVIRHVDTWTVFKVALVFHLVLYVSALVSGVLLWNVAHGTGTVDNVERFMESFGWETFAFDGQQMFDAAWRIGLFLVVGLTGLAVLAATTFNLITDIVGGVRVTVLEEEVLAVPRATVARPAAGAGRRTGRHRSG